MVSENKAVEEQVTMDKLFSSMRDSDTEVLSEKSKDLLDKIRQLEEELRVLEAMQVLIVDELYSRGEYIPF